MSKNWIDFENIIKNLLEKPGDELSGLSIAVCNTQGIIYEKAWGKRRIDGQDSLPMQPDSLCRVASISKMVTALTALALEEQKLIDLDRDISDYLGYPLRNPSFPDAPICSRQILSHTSSLRDGSSYNLPLDQNIRTLVEDHNENWSHQNPPGTYFSYSNLGFAIMATAMEKLTGKRFDRLSQELILSGLIAALKQDDPHAAASFNLQDFSEEQIQNTATLYRKMDDQEQWHSEIHDPWIAQCDDLKSIEIFRENKTLFDTYKPGDNGSVFAPQGGLRASARTLAGLARLFLGEGQINGTSVLDGKIIQKMMTPLWRFQPDTAIESSDSEMDLGYVRCSAYGIFQIMNDKDSIGCDSFLPDGGPRCWGHQGDAYGLKGGLFFDMEKGLGFSYLVTGSARDPEATRGKWSNYSLLEETILSEIVRTFWD